jgi:CRISPR-associated endonuclease/helicase Cas3
MLDNYDFVETFRRATGCAPYLYQEGLAAERVASRFIGLPTGTGKTAATVLSWLHRRAIDPANTPRKLVYCLPMRALVEQTVRAVFEWISRLALEKAVRVATLMGGNIETCWGKPSKSDEDCWEFEPASSAILVGTQDILLSMALNRGYAVSRYKWPVYFGLLNNDCLWVIDEVQLMGGALATTVQLQGWRDSVGTFGPTATWWMSATLDPEWLATVDFPRITSASPVELGQADIAEALGTRDRTCALGVRYRAPKTLAQLKQLSPENVLARHSDASLTVVVRNTVRRAIDLYDSIVELLRQPQKKRKRVGSAGGPELLLIHSRFRSPERKTLARRLTMADLALRGERLPDDLNPEENAWLENVRLRGLVIIATQIVEAGLDISAETLITELAPWANLVQRFGRCNRFGQQPDAKVLWVDLRDKEAAPYEKEDFIAARERLAQVASASVENVSAVALPDQEAPWPVIRPHDLHGLFSTDPDLAGGFTNVSPFVRDLDEANVYVFWRVDPQYDEPLPQPEELCNVPSYELQGLLGEKGTALEWNPEANRPGGTWERRRMFDIRPGMTLLLSRKQGGYSDLKGWTGRQQDSPTVFKPSGTPDGLDADPLCEGDWLRLDAHLRDTEAEALAVITDLGMEGPESAALLLAALWHDIGKVHPRWQNAVEQCAREAGVRPPFAGPWAKFPKMRTSESPEKRVVFRPRLRHEAASALYGWQRWLGSTNGWTALSVYLIAAHHGKVRTALRSRSPRGDVFGVTAEDRLPGLRGWIEGDWQPDLSCRIYGATGEFDDRTNTFVLAEPSWVAVIAELLGPEVPGETSGCEAVPANEPRALGPLRLAYLEALITIADSRASRLPGKGSKHD